MALNIFGKGKKEKNLKPRNLKPAETQPVVEAVQTEGAAFKGHDAAGAQTVLKHLYVSEKSTRLNEIGQYVFKVAASANKNEIKKHVAHLYKVTVKDVKVINLPRKRRDTGRHPGFKSGFRKAIVILAKGQTIEQARP